ncbi:MAG: signal peptide peptidase SppA [Bdellovibrionaceae bacterium]|nr:signal peptide peptidase SppA [Pseudobdellovibrionaceae bacterium]
MGKFIKQFLLVFATLFVILFLISLGTLVGKIDPRMGVHLSKNSILVLDLDGIIFDNKDFLEDLSKYAKKKEIKGVLVRINSPGGAVGPSQEIYSELKRVREELQKPVVATVMTLAASGGYYAAVSADQIVTNPGSLMGSIGVIMQFANMKDLYKWAKVDRYVIKTGEYKDSGADYRDMRPDERELFSEMITEVHTQFKTAVMNGRKLNKDVVEKYSDGRVFTGETAVKLGFADQLGTYEDSLRIIGELSGLGSEPEVFIPPKHRPDFFDLLAESKTENIFKKTLGEVFKLKIMAQPMYLMPGTMGM